MAVLTVKDYVNSTKQNTNGLGVKKTQPTSSSGVLTVQDYLKSKPAPVAPSTTTPEIVQKSTSPYKLSGATEISQAPEKKTPFGFVGEAFKAAYDTTKSTIEGAASKIQEFIGTLDSNSKNPNGTDFTKTTGETIGMTPEQRQAFYEKRAKDTTPLNRVSKLGSAALGTANIGFLPVTAQMEAAKKVPLLKYPAQAASYAFEKLGEAGSYALNKAVDIAPISDQDKEAIRPFADELGAFAVQLAGVKAGFKLTEKGGSKIIEKLPVSEKTKTGIETGVKHAAGISMTPFSHIYGVASSLLTQKLQARKDAGIEINKEEAQKIINEVKQELPNHTDEQVQTPTKPMSVAEWQEAGKPTEPVGRTQKLPEIMIRLSDGGFKMDEVTQIMQKLFEKNPTGRFTDKEITEASKEFKPTREGVKTTVEENGTEVTKKGNKIVASIKVRPEVARETSTEVKQPEAPAKEKTVESTKIDIENSQAFNIEKAIKDGDVKASDVYKDQEKGILTPKFAEGRINDVALKLEAQQKGLGDTYKKSLPADVTMKDIVEKGKSMLKEPETEKRNSRVFERLQAEHPNLKGDLEYNRMKLDEDYKKATDIVAKDKNEAYDIAMGKKQSSDVTSTAVNIVLSEKAIDEGNYDLASKLIKNRSLEQTRRGQELVAEKGSVSDNGAAKYVKELIASRLDILGKKYLSDLGKKVMKTSDKTEATKVIDKEVEKLKIKIKEKKVDVKTALSLLDELTCV